VPFYTAIPYTAPQSKALTIPQTVADGCGLRGDFVIIAGIVVLVVYFMLLILAFLPNLSAIDPFIDHDLSGLKYFINLGFFLFPSWLFNLIVGNVIFWKTVQMTWAIVEWIYKKFPGVN
jgi:hypothetical protein